MGKPFSPRLSKICNFFKFVWLKWLKWPEIAPAVAYIWSGQLHIENFLMFREEAFPLQGDYSSKGFIAPAISCHVQYFSLTWHNFYLTFPKTKSRGRL